MNAPLLVTVLLALSSLAYWLGRRRAFSVAQGPIRNLHSLPTYYGLYTAIWCGIPALLVVAVWASVESSVITHIVIAGLPDAVRNLPAEVIEKIQIFDQQSDQAEFTGFDDGQTTKTINIVTKPSARAGQFGKVYAGYGTDDRYHQQRHQDLRQRPG